MSIKGIPSPGQETSISSRWRILVVGSLFGTMVIGVWLRWALAGAVTLSLPFPHLRHAHSHLGYFGLLFPLAWLGWKAVGARTIGHKALLIYAASTVLSIVGFITNGYGPTAIVGSTLVAGVWLWSVIPLIPQMKQLNNPLGAVPLGVLLSLACIPPIAINLRTDPALAHSFVATFLASLLFLVILPSAIASRRISMGPWPFFLIAGALGALALGVTSSVPTRAGLLVYGGTLIAPVLSTRLPTHLRITWLAVVLGLAAIALGLLPNIRPVVLGAIHFLILGPVLGTLAVHWLKKSPPEWAWWLGHAIWGTMSGALVAQAFITGSWTWTVAALGGTGTLVWWVIAGWLSTDGERC